MPKSSRDNVIPRSSSRRRHETTSTESSARQLSVISTVKDEGSTECRVKALSTTLEELPGLELSGRDVHAHVWSRAEGAPP